MKIVSSPRTIGVCGIGQIGLALGLACWRSGYRVWLYGRNPGKLDQARHDLDKMDRWMGIRISGGEAGIWRTSLHCRSGSD